MPNAAEQEVVKKASKRKIRTTKKQQEISKRKAYYKATGTSPLDFRLYPMTAMHEDEIIYGFFGRLFINSPELDVLSLEVYDVCTNTVAIGARLSLWQLDKVIKLIDALTAQGKTVPMITVYVPVKMVLGETVKKDYKKFIEEIHPDKAKHICLAFSTELLFANPTQVEESMKPLHEKGFHCALLSFGEEYYPPLRLKAINVDYIYYAPEFSSRLLRGEQEALLMVDMAEKLGYKSVAQFWNGEEYEIPEGAGSESYPADYKLSGAGYRVEDIVGNHE